MLISGFAKDFKLLVGVYFFYTCIFFCDTGIKPVSAGTPAKHFLSFVISSAYMAFGIITILLWHQSCIYYWASKTDGSLKIEYRDEHRRGMAVRDSRIPERAPAE